MNYLNGKRASDKEALMERDELERSWAITRRHLEAAEQLVSSIPAVQTHSARLEEYRSYLEHNELELALDQLQEVGEALEDGGAVHCSVQFWEQMEHAAENMRLEERARYFRQRWEDGTCQRI